MKLYSPNQAMIAFFFGGVAAIPIIMVNNWNYFGEYRYNKIVFLFGFLALLGFSIFCYLNPKADLFLLRLTVAGGVYSAVADELLKKKVSLKYVKNETHSWFNVIIVAVLCFLLTVALTLSVYFIFGTI